jgi:hypothetical protein
MKNLLEIAGILTRRKVAKIEILDGTVLEGQRSKFGEFYAALLEGRFRTDQDAAEHLYGCLPTDDRYRKLKSRFRKRLLNTLFFIDANRPGTGHIESAYHSCQKDWALLQILQANGADNTVSQLARQVLQTALRFGFTDLVLGAARILRRSAADAGQEVPFQEYDALVRHHSGVLQAEISAEENYLGVLRLYQDASAGIAGRYDALSAHCQTLVRLSESFDTPSVHYLMYQAWLLRYEMEKDFEAMLQLANRALAYTTAHPDSFSADKQRPFGLKQMLACLHLGDFQSAAQYAGPVLDLLPPGGEWWFRYLEWYLLLAIRTHQHVHGMTILEQVNTHPAFRRLEAVEKTKWQTFERYLFYFLLEGEFPDALKAKVLKSFRLSRFLSEPIVHPRALRLLTMHQVIAQVLFLLDKGMMAEAAEPVDRLKTLAARQLDRDRHGRMGGFVRLLVQLRKADFKPDSLPADSLSYIAAPDTNAAYNGTALDSLEIVPFEQLWSHLLGKLDHAGAADTMEGRFPGAV